MGTEAFKMFTDKEFSVRACADMLVVAGPESLTALTGNDPAERLPGLTTHACASDAPVPDDLIAAAKVLVIEVDPDLPQSIDRLHSIGRRYPQLPKIAALRNASVGLVRTLVREGVADVVTLPFQLTELLEVSANALAQLQSKADAGARLAPLIAVIGAAGGSGATSLATHLVSDLATRLGTGREVAIVDLDLQFGAVADYLGSTGSGSVADLLQAGARLDPELVRSVGKVTDGGIAVFSAPPEIMPIEAVDVDQVLGMLGTMRRLYAGVVVDLPGNWTNWALSVLSAADQIVMVTELSVTSLRQAKRRLQLFDSVGIDPARVVVLVNRVEKRIFRSIDLSDVSDTLKREVIGGLTLEEPALNSVQNQGLLIHQVHRKSKYHADVDGLAEQLIARLDFEGS